MAIKYPVPTINSERNIKVIKTHGMLFENNLNLTNEYYLSRDIALIYKKPTPIQIVRVDYPQRSKAKIVEAYYKIPSTTDYNGIYKGKYIDYEAKETENLSFNFKHIFEHQINHLVKVKKHGGIAFVIIYFKKINEIYLIDIEQFVNEMKSDKKSIPIMRMKEIGYSVSQGYAPLIDYLTVIDNVYFKKA